jgi:hypothetical protein
VDGHGVDASFEHDCSVAEMADFADATSSFVGGAFEILKRVP